MKVDDDGHEGGRMKIREAGRGKGRGWAGDEDSGMNAS